MTCTEMLVTTGVDSPSRGSRRGKPQQLPHREASALQRGLGSHSLPADTQDPLPACTAHWPSGPSLTWLRESDQGRHYSPLFR